MPWENIARFFLSISANPTNTPLQDTKVAVALRVRAKH
jgi:hypothetical protein